MMRLRRYSIELYNELGVFETVGSLRIAAGPESLKELQRGLSRARGIGLDAQLLGADEARRLMPAASPDDLYGAVWMPGDGYLDPHGATYALAGAARDLGVEIRTQTRVTGIELGPGRRRPRRPHRGRAGGVRDRRQRGRHLGAARVGDGRRVHARRFRSTTSTSR